MRRSWYGFSSLPHPTPQSLFSRQCWHKYTEMPFTYTAMSSAWYLDVGSSQDNEVQEASSAEEKLSDFMMAFVTKCEGLGSPRIMEPPGVAVQFRIHMPEYFEHFQNYSEVQTMKAEYWSRFPPFRARLGGFLTTCVPRMCCMHQPTGVSSSDDGLRLILWNFVLIMLRPFEGGRYIAPDFSTALRRAARGVDAPLPSSEHIVGIRQVGQDGFRSCSRSES